MKIAIVICMFGLARAGNLAGGSAHGYSSGLGYSAGSGYESNLELGHGSGVGHGSALGYSAGISHASNLGYESGVGHGAGLGNGATQGYHGYDAGTYSRPAVSTVSVKSYSGPAVTYSTGYSGHGAYSPAGYAGQNYGSHRLGGNGNGYSGYENKW